MSEKDKGFGDLLKKVVNSADIKVTGLMQNASAMKDDLVKTLRNEVKGYLEKIDLRKEVDRVLEDYDIEVKSVIKFRKKKKTPKND
jgi:hypothetical protein